MVLKSIEVVREGWRKGGMKGFKWFKIGLYNVHLI